MGISKKEHLLKQKLLRCLVIKEREIKIRDGRGANIRKMPTQNNLKEGNFKRGNLQVKESTITVIDN